MFWPMPSRRFGRRWLVVRRTELQRDDRLAPRPRRPPRGNAPQHYVMTMIATTLEPGALAAGLTKAEVLKALEGGKALRAASYVFRYAH